LKTGHSRRAVLVSLLLIGVMGSVAVACGEGDGGEGRALKIGVPLALTGPIAEQAQEMVDGYELYLDQNDGQLGGVDTEIAVEDTEADPNMVVAKTRKLIENDQVDFIGGGALALEALAISDVLQSGDTAYVSPVASADDLTQRELEPWFVRPNMTSSQPNIAFGEYARDELDYQRIAIVAQDYAYGWESAGGFQFGFEAAGGEITEKVFVPLEATDYAPFVRRIPKDVDAVYAMIVGANVPRFVNAYADFGFQDIPLLGGPDMADEDALKVLDDDAVGMTTVHEYSAELPEAEQFVADWEEAYGDTPSYWGEATYTAARFMDEAITNIQDDEGIDAGEVPDWIKDNPEDFVAAVAAVELSDAPRGDGTVTIDDYNNAVTDMYVFETVSRGGKLGKDVKATLEDVNQFGGRDPEEFLEMPVFSRDFPE
jgi:branched-chain amino acid transport system substrate-binding protein